MDLKYNQLSGLYGVTSVQRIYLGLCAGVKELDNTGLPLSSLGLCRMRNNPIMLNQGTNNK